MTIESEHELTCLKRIGRIVAEALKLMQSRAVPGITTAELDEIGARFLAAKGARSAPRLVYDFPGATCISVNEEVAHGIPGDRVLAGGDVVNIDVSAELGGYFADTGGTVVVPPVTTDKQRLCDATRLALKNALAQAKSGARINYIGRAIERTARRHGLQVIYDLCGHGVGRKLHEEPQIPGFYAPSLHETLRDGAVIAVEPFLSTGASHVQEGADGWTLYAPAGNLSAQYEHSVVVTRNGPIILTAA